MKTNINNTIKNNLWRARQRSGFERKQIAFLLSRKVADEISRYEKGINLPNLKNALKLEIIYQTPIRLLFQDLFEQSRNEIGEIRERHAHLFPDNRWFPKPSDQLTQEEFCFYAELLKSRVPNKPELGAVTKHIIALNNTVSDYKQGHNPFPK